MKTKYTLTSSAIVFAILGIAFTFVSVEVMQLFGSNISKYNELFLQFLGSLYLALAILNWNSRLQVIGGIYNRPLAFANYLHGVLVSIALVRFVLNDSSSLILLVLTGFYLVYTILFYLIMFRHPKNLNSEN